MKREKIPRAFATRAPPRERGRFPREITLFINLIAASKIKQRNRVNHSSSRCLFARNCVNRRNLRCNVVNWPTSFRFLQLSSCREILPSSSRVYNYLSLWRLKNFASSTFYTEYIFWCVIFIIIVFLGGNLMVFSFKFVFSNEWFSTIKQHFTFPIIPSF